MSALSGKWTGTLEYRDYRSDRRVTLPSNTVVLTGKATENDAAVDLRITLTVTASQIAMERESKKAGEGWMFRNRYAFTR